MSRWCKISLNILQHANKWKNKTKTKASIFKSFRSIRTNSTGTCLTPNCTEPEQHGPVMSAGAHARTRCWQLTSESLRLCRGAISGFESVQFKPGTAPKPWFSCSCVKLVMNKTSPSNIANMEWRCWPTGFVLNSPLLDVEAVWSPQATERYLTVWWDVGEHKRSFDLSRHLLFPTYSQFTHFF